jgi:hypothetical protein
MAVEADIIASKFAQFHSPASGVFHSDAAGVQNTDGPFPQTTGGHVRLSGAPLELDTRTTPGMPFVWNANGHRPLHEGSRLVLVPLGNVIQPDPHLTGAIPLSLVAEQMREQVRARKQANKDAASAFIGTVEQQLGYDGREVPASSNQTDRTQATLYTDAKGKFTLEVRATTETHFGQVSSVHKGTYARAEQELTNGRRRRVEVIQPHDLRVDPEIRIIMMDRTGRIIPVGENDFARITTLMAANVGSLDGDVREVTNDISSRKVVYQREGGDGKRTDHDREEKRRIDTLGITAVAGEHLVTIHKLINGSQTDAGKEPSPAVNTLISLKDIRRENGVVVMQKRPEDFGVRVYSASQVARPFGYAGNGDKVAQPRFLRVDYDEREKSDGTLEEIDSKDVSLVIQAGSRDTDQGTYVVANGTVYAALIQADM